MRLDRRPLLDNRLDAPLFVGRKPELERLTRSVALGFNAIVTGPRGAGKTSLLRRLMWTLREEAAGSRAEPRMASQPTVYVSASDVADAATLLQRVATRLGDGEARWSADAGPEAILERLAAAHAGQLDADADPRAPRATRAVALVDDVPVALGRSLFGALRDDLWRLGITWVIACADSDERALLLPPVDAFFETVIRLEPLRAEEAIEVVRRRTGDELSAIPPAQLERLLAASNGTPRHLIDAVRAVVVEGIPLPEMLGQLDSRDTRLGLVSRGAAMLAAELDAAGAMSASDKMLQQRMGVSRPRLVTLFGELGEAGLVQEITAPARGPGRPAVLYRLLTPGEERR